MLDKQVVEASSKPPKKGSSLLLAPLEVVVPDDCPLEVYDWSWESLVRVFSSDALPVILKADPNQSELLYRLASFHNVALKTVFGMPGDYPSFWSISYSAYPRIDYRDLTIAKEESIAHGGSNIPKKKLPEDEMKGLDPRQQANIEHLADAEWSSDAEN